MGKKNLTSVSFSLGGKVGTKLFRVPRDRFDDPGAQFPYRLLLPADENSPFDLPVDESSFRNFLRVMYPFWWLLRKPYRKCFRLTDPNIVGETKWRSMGGLALWISRHDGNFQRSAIWLGLKITDTEEIVLDTSEGGWGSRNLGRKSER